MFFFVFFLFSAFLYNYTGVGPYDRYKQGYFTPINRLINKQGFPRGDFTPINGVIGTLYL